MDQKAPQNYEEWTAAHKRRVEVRIAERKAEQARARRVNAELEEELAAEAADPCYRRRKRLKAGILAFIGNQWKNGPVRRSRVYEALNGGRYKDIFSQAIEELLEEGKIVRTERRDGPRGRVAVAYTLPPT